MMGAARWLGGGNHLGTWMAAAVNLTPTYPLRFVGYTFPGYTALYTVILNIVVATVLTSVFNAISAQRVPFDRLSRPITTPRTAVLSALPAAPAQGSEAST